MLKGRHKGAGSTAHDESLSSCGETIPVFRNLGSRWEWLMLRPGRAISEERLHGILWIGGQVGLRAGMDAEMKIVRNWDIFPF
jgi:hypothetical protein